MVEPCSESPSIRVDSELVAMVNRRARIDNNQIHTQRQFRVRQLWNVGERTRQTVVNKTRRRSASKLHIRRPKPRFQSITSEPWGGVQTRPFWGKHHQVKQEEEVRPSKGRKKVFWHRFADQNTLNYQLLSCILGGIFQNKISVSYWKKNVRIAHWR